MKRFNRSWFGGIIYFCSLSLIGLYCHIFIGCSPDEVVITDEVDGDTTGEAEDGIDMVEIPVTDPELGNPNSDTASVRDTKDTGEPSPITWTDCDQWPGSHPCDFTLKDKDGNEWNLYDHYGTVMVIDFSTMWCSVCKRIAPDAQAFQDKYIANGYDFMWVTVLIDDATGGTVESSELSAWVNEYGMTTSPVLAGDRDMVDLSGIDGYPISAWPTLVVITDEMVLYQGLNGWNETTIFGWVDEVLESTK